MLLHGSTRLFTRRVMKCIKRPPNKHEGERPRPLAIILTLCAVVFTMRRISVSAHITLCPVVFSMRRISVSAHITRCAVVFTMRRISVSAHITLCAVVFTMRRISVAAHITLCAVVFTVRPRTLLEMFSFSDYSEFVLSSHI